MRRTILRLLSSVRSSRAESELEREIRSHLQLLEDKYVADGMCRQEARYAARRAFGGVEQVKERQRDARMFRSLAAGRLARRRSPRFSAPSSAPPSAPPYGWKPLGRAAANFGTPSGCLSTKRGGAFRKCKYCAVGTRRSRPPRCTPPGRACAGRRRQVATRPSGFPLKNVLQSSNMNPR